MKTEYLNPALAEHFSKGKESFRSKLIVGVHISQQEKVIRFADNVFDVLTGSGRFSTLTMLQTRDEYKRKRLVLFMEEIDRNKGRDIAEPLSRLSIALRPQIFLSEYFVEPQRSSQRDQWLREVTKRRFGAKNTPRKVWQFSSVL